MRTSTRTTKPKVLNWIGRLSTYMYHQDGFIGKWKAFSIYHDSCRSTNDENKQVLKCFLPGIKDNLGWFKTEDDAKEYAQRIFNHWLKGAGL